MNTASTLLAHYCPLLAYITTLLYMNRMHSLQPPARSLGDQRRKRTTKADTTDAADVTEAWTALKHATNALPCASLAPIDNRGGGGKNRWSIACLQAVRMTALRTTSYSCLPLYVFIRVSCTDTFPHPQSPLSIFTPASLGHPLLVFQEKNKLYSPTHVCSIFSC